MAHHHDQRHKDAQHDHHAPKKGIHRDWRFWAVVLMIAAMVIYVVTMNEAIEPGGQIQQEVPADAE
jgi:hypothetical protein